MNAHELMVFDELERQGFSVFFPRQDRGVDCLVADQKDLTIVVPVQIKGSKKHGDGGGWFVLSRKKLCEYLGQIWIFVWPEVSAAQKFEGAYVLVEAGELLRRKDAVSPNLTGDRIDIYFERREGKTLQTRGLTKNAIPESDRDFTKFDGGWSLLRSRLPA